jgi:hypothetical protein
MRLEIVNAAIRNKTTMQTEKENWQIEQAAKDKEIQSNVEYNQALQYYGIQVI